jgi:hypothetical protein
MAFFNDNNDNDDKPDVPDRGATKKKRHTLRPSTEYVEFLKAQMDKITLPQLKLAILRLLCPGLTPRQATSIAGLKGNDATGRVFGRAHVMRLMEALRPEYTKAGEVDRASIKEVEELTSDELAKWYTEIILDVRADLSTRHRAAEALRKLRGMDADNNGSNSTEEGLIGVLNKLIDGDTRPAAAMLPAQMSDTIDVEITDISDGSPEDKQPATKED